MPAIDDDGVFVFDSNAILLYLGEKTGKFMSDGTPEGRAQLLSWLMFFATGVGPFRARRSISSIWRRRIWNMRTTATSSKPIAITHSRRASGQDKYMVGDTYTIVDMAFWGWARLAPFVLGDDVREISQRQTAGRRGLGKAGGARAIALKDKFTFKAEMDDEARHIMFGHLKTKAA